MANVSVVHAFVKSYFNINNKYIIDNSKWHCNELQEFKFKGPLCVKTNAGVK